MQAYSAVAMPLPPPRPSTVTLGSFSLWFGVALVGMTVAYNLLRTSTAGECVWGLLHVMRALFAALLLASLAAFRVRREERFVDALRPLVINLFTLCIIVFVPFSALWQEAKFGLNRTAYETAAGWAAEGVLPVDQAGWATLPPGYSHLAADGRVRVDISAGATTVFFPSHGALAGGSGLVFRGDGLLPQAGDFGLQWVQVTQAGPHWYFATGR